MINKVIIIHHLVLGEKVTVMWDPGTKSRREAQDACERSCCPFHFDVC